MNAQHGIRVAIADDHAIVRRGLRRIFDDHPDIAIAGEAWDGRSAVDLVRMRHVDVLLLDLLMPGQGGVDAITMIRAKSPQTAVVVLSTCPEEHFASKMIGKGARAYLNKSCAPEEIVQAVRTVAAGERYLTDEVQAALLDARVPARAKYAHEKLNDREFQLLIRIARGQGTNEIAQELSLSPKTTSTYRNSMLAKLGLKTNSELTHYAMVHGLID